jgi:hypothetical protein
MKERKKNKTAYLCNRADLPSLPLPWAIGPRLASSPRLPAWAVQHRRGRASPSQRQRLPSLLVSLASGTRLSDAPPSSRNRAGHEP